jgi:hypothetical protein
MKPTKNTAQIIDEMTTVHLDLLREISLTLNDTDLGKVNRSSVTNSIDNVDLQLTDLNQHLESIAVSAGFYEGYLQRIAVALEKIASGLGYAETPSYYKED